MRDIPLWKAPCCHARGCHGNGKAGIWVEKVGGTRSCRAAGAQHGAGAPPPEPQCPKGKRVRVPWHHPPLPHLLPQAGNKDAPTPPTHTHSLVAGCLHVPPPAGISPSGISSKRGRPQSLRDTWHSGVHRESPTGHRVHGARPQQGQGCSPALLCLSFPTLGSCDPGSTGSCLQPTPGPERPPSGSS